jgi:hypothetical protein
MKILAASGDLFFTVKLQAMARRAGADIRVVKSIAELPEAAAGSFEALVVDLESRAFDSLAVSKEMGSRWPNAARWAFAAHGNVDLLKAAKDAGWQSMARGAFEVQFPMFLEGK